MRPEKESMVLELSEEIKESDFLILADYGGMKVEATQALKKKLGETEARFKIVKNTMFKRALEVAKGPRLDDGLNGTTAMVTGSGDVVQVAKVLEEFVKANELPVVKIGALDGAILTKEEIAQLAGLPPKEVLQGKLVGVLAAPMTQLVGVMNQKVSSLLYVLNAVKEKKQQA